MKEQSDQSENPLFDWADMHNQKTEVPQKPEEKNKPSSDDELFSSCAQCEIGYCARHAKSKKLTSDQTESSTKTESATSFTNESTLSDEDLASSNRVADQAIRLAEIEAEAQRPLTDAELDEWFKNMNEDLGKVS